MSIFAVITVITGVVTTSFSAAGVLTGASATIGAATTRVTAATIAAVAASFLAAAVFAGAFLAAGFTAADFTAADFSFVVGAGDFVVLALVFLIELIVFSTRA